MFVRVRARDAKKTRTEKKPFPPPPSSAVQQKKLYPRSLLPSLLLSFRDERNLDCKASLFCSVKLYLFILWFSINKTFFFFFSPQDRSLSLFPFLSLACSISNSFHCMAFFALKQDEWNEVPYEWLRRHLSFHISSVSFHFLSLFHSDSDSLELIPLEYTQSSVRMLRY